MSLALKIKALRLKNNKSLQDVADEVGASKAHIWDLETGKSKNPTIEVLTRLANAFNVSISELVGENPESDEGKPEIVAMYRDLKNMDPNDVETIKLMMERLKDRK